MIQDKIQLLHRKPQTTVLSLMSSGSPGAHRPGPAERPQVGWKGDFAASGTHLQLLDLPSQGGVGSHVLEERGLEADPQVCLLPVAVFLKWEKSPSAPVSSSPCSSLQHRQRKGGEHDQASGKRGVMMNPTLPLHSSLCYFGFNLAPGLLIALWRSLSLALSWSSLGFTGPSAKYLLAKHILASDEQISVLCEVGTAREFSFFCPWLIWKAFPYDSELGISEVTVSTGILRA